MMRLVARPARSVKDARPQAVDLDALHDANVAGAAINAFDA